MFHCTVQLGHQKDIPHLPQFPFEVRQHISRKSTKRCPISMRHCLAIQSTKVNGCGTYLSIRLLYMEVFGDFSKDAGICPRLLFMAIWKCWSALVQPRNVCGIEWPAPGAAMRRRIEIIQWARGNYCAWDELACRSAAFGGHLKTLQWARANECPWSYSNCSEAVEGEHSELFSQRKPVDIYGMSGVTRL